MSLPLEVTPSPGAAPRRRRILAHGRLELTMLLRNGEQLLLTVVLPVGLLLVLSLTEIIDIGGGTRAERLDVVVPSMVALAILSTSFTALAIQTGFERRYGVLRRVGTTPLSRADLLAGKAVAVLVVETGQIAVLTVIGAALGWRPDPVGVLLLVPLTLLGSATLAALALLLAGVVRAEATLAVANLAYLLLAGAGVVIPLDQLPDSLQPFLELLPSTALAEALRVACSTGTVPLTAVLVLVGWLAAASVAVARWFRWE